MTPKAEGGPAWFIPQRSEDKQAGPPTAEGMPALRQGWKGSRRLSEGRNP